MRIAMNVDRPAQILSPEVPMNSVVARTTHPSHPLPLAIVAACVLAVFPARAVAQESRFDASVGMRTQAANFLRRQHEPSDMN